jgi:hypothetical protein
MARADIRALYRRDSVALEGPDTHGIMKRAASPEEFRRGLQAVTWDELQLARYCGCLIWNYMAVPFILADPDFETKALRRTVAPGESLRRLQHTPLSRAEFPPAVSPSSGVRHISAVMSSIAAGRMSNSSAATWINAVRTLWPSSTLPVNTVTCPSAATRIQASSQREVLTLPVSESFPEGRLRCGRQGPRNQRKRHCERAGGQERSPGKRAGWLRADHGLAIPPPAAANVSAMARSTALMIRSCVPQRHKFVRLCARIAALESGLPPSTNSCARMIIPAVQ